MPQRVSSFFKCSAHSLEHQVWGKAKKRTFAPRSDNHARAFRSSEGLLSNPFNASGSVEEVADDPGHVPAMTNAKTADSRTSNAPAGSHRDHHKIAFPSIPFGRSNKEHHVSTPASLDWKLESPPIVFYGDVESSSGALVSGQLFLDVKVDSLEISSFRATLHIRITHKKPFNTHCPECSSQYTELKNWSFLPQPLAMTKGMHTFPFSILLEGHLPASMENALLSIAYEFKAEAVPNFNGLLHPPPAKLEKVLHVKRSLPESSLPHHSVRVFPPTNIKVSVHYPQVIHPIGNNTLSIRMDGVSKHNPVPDTVEYWRLKKLTWRLEETVTTMAPVCDRHQLKTDDLLAQQKGILRTQKRIIGEKTHFSGWKSNYDGTHDSNVEHELEYCLAKGARPTCDTKSRDGTEVSHQLLVEMVISQEWVPANKPALVTQTGVGRVLRMHFGCVLTERAGIGISWDNEAPPIYQDVPASPPAYGEEHAIIGAPAACAGVEHTVPLGGFLEEPTNRMSVHEGRQVS